MDKLFSYAKFTAFALIALLVARLALYNLHSPSANTIIYVTGIVTMILMCGFFVGLLLNSKKGSPVIIPSIIGVVGKVVFAVSLVLFMVFFLKMNIESPDESPMKLLQVASALDTVAVFTCAAAFIYLSFYFGKTSSPRFAAWAIALVLIVFFALGQIVNKQEWQDFDAMQRFNMIRYFANNVLLYGANIWFLLSFANLKRK